MSVPAAYAQSGSFDAAAAVETFLTDASSYGAESASVGGVTSSGDVVTASDVTWTWASTVGEENEEVTVNVTFTAPSVEIEGLMETADGYGAARIAIPEMALNIETTGTEEAFKYDVTATDYEIVNGSWQAFPTIADDESAPVSRFAPLVDWAVHQSYDSSSISKLTGNIIVAGDVQELSYGPVTVGPVRDGVHESFEYGPIESTQTTEIPNEDGTSTSVDIAINYGASRGKDLDIRPFAAFLTGTGATDGPQPMIGLIELDSMSMSGGDMFNLSIGKNTIENITVDPSHGPLLEKLDSFVLALEADEEPDPQAMATLMMDVYGAFGIGKYGMDDITISTPEGTAGLESVTIEDLSAAGLGLLSVNGFSMDATEGTGSLGTFELADLVFPEREAFVNMMLSNMMGMPSDLQTTLGAMPYLGRITVKDLDITTPSGEVKLGLFENKLEDYVPPIPTNISIELKGLELPAALLPDPQSQMMARAMQLDPVKADGTIKLRWDEDTQRVELDKDIDVDGVGRIQADATLSGIPKLIFENPSRANEAVATAAVNSLSATFTDEGVTRFILGMISEQAGVPAEQIVEGIAQQASMQVAMVTGDEQLSSEVSDTLSTFLNDPETLSFTASPAAPVAVAQIIGAAMTAPQALPGLLNLSLSANQ
ncbi:hypothetical protein L1787_13960 [Acuticoccus sp. M5D2P5]|uniref:hypothetical protein n=1 Tax=Acuticoccus kalidii TaxID=2910977 RepID=UPI001F454256|nr:hypothetical protein [Acuticoccus kalidii]MCF3934510.1 hypothetical protein [Acuticoccus kalidii]